MRQIKIQEPTSEIWTRWRSDCDAAALEMMAAVAAGQAPQVKELYKRKSIKESFFFAKSAPFFGKCAYCEVAIVDYQHGDVEHYRPKLGVTDENDIRVAHPGYYWLAYDWRNLLPSCIVCNEPKIINGKKVGKHNRFPVVGAHALCAEDTPNEQPLLLHPGVDNPADHLIIDSSTGMLGHRTTRGKACIEVLGLNLRDQLVDDRRNACEAARSLLVRLIYDRDQKARQELQSIRVGKRTFSLAQNTVIVETLQRLL